jgi:phenylpropionate dioxygenase-like ring-hydroxylating dioxygenase large terminal subunit
MSDAARERELLRRYWHAAAYADALETGPVAITILDEPVVLARIDGAPVATVDRCPHRGAPLSGGDVVDRPDGQCLRCPYHALHFNGSGRAVHLPAAASDRLPSRLDLDLLPCVEQYGIIWLSLDAEPLGSIPPWGAFDNPGGARFQMVPEAWHAMPSRIAENFNDLAHFATVHAATFGDAATPEVPAESIEVDDDNTTIRHEVVMRQLDRVTLDGPLVPIDASYSYTHSMPFSTELRIHFDDDRTEWIQMTSTPVSATTSMVFQQSARNFDVDGDLDAWRDFQASVNDEDRRLLETIRPAQIALDGSGSLEVALSVDTFTITYRRLWRELLS